jgi:ferredoxin
VALIKCYLNIDQISKLRVKVDKVPEDVAETCREAAENWPVEAIQIEK